MKGKDKLQPNDFVRLAEDVELPDGTNLSKGEDLVFIKLSDANPNVLVVMSAAGPVEIHSSKLE